MNRQARRAMNRNGHSLLMLPPSTLERLRQLASQRQAIDAEMQTISRTAIEVLGLEGAYNIDLATGEIKMSPEPNQESALREAEAS